MNGTEGVGSTIVEDEELQRGRESLCVYMCVCGERFLGVGVWHENKRRRAGLRTHWCMRNYWGFTCRYLEKKKGLVSCGWAEEEVDFQPFNWFVEVPSEIRDQPSIHCTNCFNSHTF